MDNADNKTALLAKNFDVAPHVTRLTAELKAIGQSNTEKEKPKADLKNKTIDLEEEAATGYTDASGLILGTTISALEWNGGKREEKSFAHESLIFALEDGSREQFFPRKTVGESAVRSNGFA